MEIDMVEKLQEVHDGIIAVQEKVDQKADKESLDGLDKDFIQKAADDASSALEEIQNLKAADKFKEIEEKQNTLETSIIGLQRQGGPGENGQAHKHEIAKYLRKGTVPDSDIVLDNIKEYLVKNTYGAEDHEIELMAKDLLAGSNPDGGFFVTAERSNRMIERIFETSPLRGVVNIETTTTDVFEFVLDDDEADAGWIGEVSARGDTDTPQVGLLKIPIHELFAQPKATQKVLDDAGFDIEGWLTKKVSRRIGRTENTAFVVGNGSQKPKGFLSYTAWAAAGVYERDAVEQINSGTSGSFDADNIIDLQNSLIEDYQSNATFGMKRATFTDVMQLKDGNGRYLLNPAILAQSSEKILLGNEVVFLNDMPSVAADALAIVVADFEEFYTIVDRFDIRVLRDPFTQKPFVKFYTTKRVGAAVTNFEAGKILKLAT